MSPKLSTIFKIAVITGLRYIELQRLYDNPQWYNETRNQIILPKEAQKKVKQRLPQRTIDKLPSSFRYIFNAFKASNDVADQILETKY